MLSARYGEALAYAVRVHDGQVRKGTNIPYVAHLLAVSGLVLEADGTEDQAIAGLLHDALEDQPDRTSFDKIADLFGPEPARIVRACSDTEVTPKPPWEQRKRAYLAHLETTDQAVLRVSLADKLHNARSIRTDMRTHGETVWDRFNQGREAQVRYYGALAEVFTRRLPGAQADELAEAVKRM
jgi:(p)ppGpp synthase/HD superfamily hydrolase